LNTFQTLGSGTALAYLLGGIPFGLLIARLKGIDIREHGSGNIGATNVLRTCGKPLGIAVFILDVLKGLVPSMVFPCFFHAQLVQVQPETAAVIFGLAAILGHMFSPYLRLKGGKGVATSAGVVLGVAPVETVCVIAVWVGVTFTFGYVSLGSIIAAGALPILIVLTGLFHPFGLRTEGVPRTVFCFACLVGSLIIYRHKSNIRHLIAGTENKIQSREKTTEETS